MKKILLALALLGIFASPMIAEVASDAKCGEGKCQSGKCGQGKCASGKCGGK